AQAPQNGEALDGLSRVSGVRAGRVEDSISSGHLEEAALTLASFKSAAPNDLRSGPLEQRLSSAQMSKALTDGNFERAAALLRQAQQSGSSAPDQIARWRSDLARRQEEARVQRLAGLIADRIRDGKLTDAEDSAKIYLQQLESSAPSSASTQRAVHDLSAAYLKKARDAAIAGNSTEQERWLNEARGLGMKPADIGALQRELAGARQKAVQADAERALRLARAALREGRLTDPGEGSAASYLSQLQSSDPANAALPDLGRELAARLRERARAAVLAGKSADADLAQAKRWGADPKDVQAVQQLGAPVAKTTVDTASLASSLKRLRASPPDYPPSALTQRITGNVTLEFTVSTSGEPRDVHVVEATPPGIFDQAAINMRAGIGALQAASTLQTYPEEISRQLSTLRDRLEVRAYSGQALADLQGTVSRFDQKLNQLAGSHAADSPQLGRPLLLWHQYAPVLDPVVSFTGQPYVDSDTAGSSLSREGRAHYAAVKRAPLFASDSAGPLQAQLAALSATLQRSSSDAAARLRTLLLAGVLAALSLAGAAGYFQLTRSKHERAALEAQEQTRDILKTVREGLFLLDSEHRIGTVWSDALTRMFSRQDFAGLSFERLLKDLVPPATLTTATKYIKLLWGDRAHENLMKSINPLGQLEVKIDNGHGGRETRYLQFDFHRVMRQDGVKHVLCAVGDITSSVL